MRNCLFTNILFKIKYFDWEEFWFNFWDKTLMVALWLLIIEVFAGVILLILTIINVI